MEPTFWINRYKNNQASWHQKEVNLYLEKHIHVFDKARQNKQRILVPLCGKTRDMIYLAERGFNVVGIELSEQACHEFFSENDIAHEVEDFDRFSIFVSDNISLFCGDIFDVDTDMLLNIGGIYDRAALVALPPEMRQRYAQFLCDISHPHMSLLLLSMEYKDGIKPPPPHPVFEEEIRRLYDAHFDINLLERVEIIDNTPKYQDLGFTSLKDSVYWLKGTK